MGFFMLGVRGHKRSAITWLVVMSLIFYAWFRIDYLCLLVILIVFNYGVGIKLSEQHQLGKKSILLLSFGILINLSVLCYYKYTNFMLGNLNALMGTHFVLQNIIMPIGISFFTFQKIAYLIDAYRGETEEYNFLDFSLFVMYFPQLIAGPIVHHKDLIPQFRQASLFKLNPSDMSAGIIMFVIGLGKKILLADQLSIWVNNAFQAAHQGVALSLIEASVAAFGFSFQIYFDFSAYSDMALGLALMMGIRLPLNFNSPYKASNIIDFWRRWHMTLSKFLKDYVYIPLGGNRKGLIHRHLNLMLTMLIGGLWHGAGWTFVFWGLLHGFFLSINHAWNHIKQTLGINEVRNIRLIAQAITFFSVTAAWVFFRAESFKSAVSILKGMVGLNGIILPVKYENKLNFLKAVLNIQFNDITYYHGAKQLLFLLISLFIVWCLPNTQQLCAEFQPTLNKISSFQLKGYWQRIPLLRLKGNQSILTIAATPLLAVALSTWVLCLLIFQIYRANPMQNFIYFQF
jgi:alginate O-acetyltransferase complex protein AlgI